MDHRGTKIVTTQVGADKQLREEAVLVEGPLQIRLNGEPLTVTMRTPGEDEALAHGLALGEGLITKSASVGFKRHACAQLEDADILNLVVSESDLLEKPRARGQISSASCGLCGVQSLTDIAVPESLTALGEAIQASMIPQWFKAMEHEQRHFQQTGGSHAAALFAADGELIAISEDVGRHNAVDKVIGKALGAMRLHDVVGLAVSGRVSFEIVSKAARAGIPYLAAVSAPSTLAISTAERCGMCLLGFCRGQRFTVYSHADRLVTNGVIDYV